MLFEEGHHEDGWHLGREYLINDTGYITAAHGPATHRSIKNFGSSTPPATLVTASHSNLAIDLIWDASVASAPSGFEQAVIDAAMLYVDEFTGGTIAGGTEVINIHVGWGEINGHALSPSALGESESSGYLTNYATVTGALGAAGYSFSALNEPTGAQFFLTSAQAKDYGLINATASATDGFVGFATLQKGGYSWNFTASTGRSNTGTGANQYDLEAVAWHEISEVLGRIGMEGQHFYGKATYTPLDLFNFASEGVLARSPSGGYFSLDNGKTSLGVFNAINGGDIADWASSTSIGQSVTIGNVVDKQGVQIDYDAYDAFAFYGVNGDVSLSDLALDSSIGFDSFSAAEKFVA
jgi:hypothetical protein